MEIQRTLATIDSALLADYILEKHGPMSHLKLQKLLYLIEGYHLAYYGSSLINDDFEAWTHGPVSRKIYDLLKDKSRLYVDLHYEQGDYKHLPSELMRDMLTDDQFELVNEVLGLYDKESGFDLEALTHSQTPWINARKGVALYEKCTNIISKRDMTVYFRQFVN